MSPNKSLQTDRGRIPVFWEFIVPQRPRLLSLVVRGLGPTMERGFDIQTGSLAIGDPTMGLVTYDLRFSPGRYRCDPGSLRRPTGSDTQTITLDGPYLFVVDASLAKRFLEWYHRAFNECGFIIPNVAMRLDEAAKMLGAEVGFYWEESLSGQAQEGTYALETSLIRKCN